MRYYYNPCIRVSRILFEKWAKKHPLKLTTTHRKQTEKKKEE